MMLMATPIALTTMMDKDDDAAALQQNNSSSKMETVPASSVDTIAAINLADTNGTTNSPLRPEIQILKDEHSALLRENEMLKEIWERIIQQQQQAEEKASASSTTTPKCNNYNNHVVSSDDDNNNKGDDANIEDEMKNLHLEDQQQQYSDAPQMTPLSSDCDEDTSNEQGVPNTIDISDRSLESCYADEPDTNITDHHQSDQDQQNQQEQQLEKKKFNYRRRSDEEEPIDYFEIYS
jgi:hypothetical protein